MWETGSIPIELGWNVLVILPKGNSYNRGVGMLDVVSKVVEVVIYTRITTVFQFHNILHRFRAGRGAWTTIMELKIAPGLASVESGSIPR